MQKTAFNPNGIVAYNVAEHGISGDAVTPNTDPIQQLIDKVAATGGGIVAFPAGIYVTGTIQLKNNITLYLSPGAVIMASNAREHYSHSSLIYAEDSSNVAIVGTGIIDGNGAAFWKRKDGIWVQGPWRTDSMLQFVRCQDLLLESITVRNSPHWTIHPMDCDRMNIRGISILNPISIKDKGPNSDGIDPDGCSNLRISDCFIQSGDDSIVLKITDRPSGRKTCSNITITNCILTTVQTAIKVGTETHGQFRNIAISNCVVTNAGCGLGLWMADGGTIDGLTANNISIDMTDQQEGHYPYCGHPIYIRSYPRQDGGPLGALRNVTISNITAKGNGGIFVGGTKEEYIENLTLADIDIFMCGRFPKPQALTDNPPYPHPLWGFIRAPYGIYCRYVNGLTLRNTKLIWNVPENPDWGSALRCVDVDNLQLDAFTARQAKGAAVPTVCLSRVNNAFVRNCYAPAETTTFLKISQASRNVTIIGNDLSHAQEPIAVADTDADEVFETGNRLVRRRDMTQ